MKRRPFAAGLTAAVAAGLLVAGGAAVGATASAGTAAPAPAPLVSLQPVWVRASCATGQIARAAYDNGWIVLTGTAVMCGGLPRSRFAVVPFWPDRNTGVAVIGHLVTYAPIGEPTGFQALLTADATRAEGVCVVTTSRSEDRHCVTLADDRDGGLTMSRAPDDSPAWSKPVDLSATLGYCDPHDPGGLCGSCVNVTPVDLED